jgi:dipeptidyl aminopeptidase/acylaminoacyl peptidase
LISNEESNPVQAGPGFLVYGTNETLYARPFDLTTFQIGKPTVLAQEVMFNTSSARTNFSVSDGVLAYRQTGFTELAWFDRRGTALNTVGPPGRYVDPTLSPDQRQIAVARVDADVGASHIVLIDADTGATTPLTSGSSWDRSPIWSPDGDQVSFASKRSQVFEMFERPANGSGQERALAHPGWPAAWSRGGFIVYQLLGGTTGSWIVNGPAAAGSMPEFAGEQPQLSPDGDRLAYTSRETGTYEVYVRSLQDPLQKRKVSDRGGVQPRWRGDGKELFYLDRNRKLMAVDVTGTRAAAPRELFTTPLQASTAFIVGRVEYDVAADGQRFLLNVPVPGAVPPITVVMNWTARLTR